MIGTAIFLDARNAVRELSDGGLIELMGWLIAREPAAVLDAIDAMQAYYARPEVDQ